MFSLAKWFKYRVICIQCCSSSSLWQLKVGLLISTKNYSLCRFQYSILQLHVDGIFVHQSTLHNIFEFKNDMIETSLV